MPASIEQELRCLSPPPFHGRVFLTLQSPTNTPDNQQAHNRVHIDRPLIEDMLADAFGPILRAGGKEIEVSLRMTNTLAAMHANLPAMRAPIEGWARRHARQLAAMMEDRDDHAVFEQTYKRLWPTLA